MEWSSKTIWLFVWMVIWTWWDWKRWVISRRQGIFVLAAGLVWQMAENHLLTPSVIGGILLGMGAWGFSLATKDQFGRGDALVILCLGIYLGFSESLSVLLWGLLIASIVSVYLLAVKKWSRKQSLPFIPCLTAGYAMMMLMAILSR